jgi:hypothetical protein
LARVMIDPGELALFVPPHLPDFKAQLFEAFGKAITNLGGQVIRYDYSQVSKIPDEIIPIVGCTPQFRELFIEWQRRRREFIYWDRGYFRRAHASWQRGLGGGYYRFHRNCFQMQSIREDVNDDRWDALNLGRHIAKWSHGGRHIVVADTGTEYWDTFADRHWVERAIVKLRQHTDRPIFVRRKSDSTPLANHLVGAHALVAHGSIAAIEAVAMGCPVFVDLCSAAALMGRTDLTKIEHPVRPHRWAWFRSLAYCQYNERELVDGTLFRLVW